MGTILLVDHSLPTEHRTGDDPQQGIELCVDVMAAARMLIGTLDLPIDSLIEFDETARWSDIDRTAESLFAFVFGTNLGEAVALARSMMPSPDRLVVVAHSRPSAHRQASGHVFFTFPPAHETTRTTAAEIDRCRESDIRVDVVVVPPAEPRLAWPDEIVDAVRRTGGTFRPTTTPLELREAIEHLSAPPG